MIRLLVGITNASYDCINCKEETQNGIIVPYIQVIEVEFKVLLENGKCYWGEKILETWMRKQTISVQGDRECRVGPSELSRNERWEGGALKNQTRSTHEWWVRLLPGLQSHRVSCVLTTALPESRSGLCCWPASSLRANHVPRCLHFFVECVSFPVHTGDYIL